MAVVFQQLKASVIPFKTEMALIATSIVLGITTIGVTKTLLEKKNSVCLLRNSTKTSYGGSYFYRKCNYGCDGIFRCFLDKYDTV